MNIIKKELKKFLVAGVSAVCTDFFTYYILLDFMTPGISKFISFLSGTIVAYFINKYWTFGKHEKSFKEVIKFGILYCCTLGVNVLVNKIVLNNTTIVFFAFLIATSVSTLLNFIGQKFWVFK